MSAIEVQDLSPRSQEKRRAIIDAAQALFLDSGFGATSMDAVAEKAGVSKRTVYSHFDSKESLFGSVMSSMCTMLGGGASEYLGPAAEETQAGKVILGDLPEGDVRHVMHTLGCRFLGLVTQPEAIALFRVVIAESGRFPELGDEFYRNGAEPLVQSLAQYLSLQVECGKLAIDDPCYAAHRFLSMVKEPIHMYILLGQAKTPTEADVEEAVASSVSAFLKIYAAD